MTVFEAFGNCFGITVAGQRLTPGKENSVFMEGFRFAVMGAGNIAKKFCEAARLAGYEVTAVASKSSEKARGWAAANGVKGAYGNYEEMLLKERPDCVYIAMTPDSHHALAMLCLERGIPVLVEKAAFLNSAQAQEVFSLSEKKGIFVMEALWSRFLPAVKKAREWIGSGYVGNPSFAQIDIGFLAPPEAGNRYRNPKLGGGAAFDITVYAYEIARFLLGREESLAASAVWGPTGVDVTDHVVLHFPEMCASLTTSFDAALEGIGFGPLNAFCLMVFCLLYIPCAAALATIRKESGSWSWMGAAALFQLAVAWVVTFFVYQAACLIF